MARLTEAARRRIPKSQFAIPSDDGYPVNTPQRAKVALGLVGMHGSPAEKTAVRSKVAKEYPGIEQTKGPQGRKNGARNGNGNGNGMRAKANGARNGNGNGNGAVRNNRAAARNGNGNSNGRGATARLSRELGRRLDERDRRR
jgi:hypothetical protein